MPSTVRLSRALTSIGSLVGVFRDLEVYIDGTHAGSVPGLASSDFPVEAGTHVVYVAMDWCRSRELSFSCQDNDVVLIECHAPRLDVWRVLTYPKDFFVLHRRMS